MSFKMGDRIIFKSLLSNEFVKGIISYKCIDNCYLIMGYDEHYAQKSARISEDRISIDKEYYRDNKIEKLLGNIT